MSNSCKYLNFTAFEKTILFELIDSRKDIIKKKKQNEGKMVKKKLGMGENYI